MSASAALALELPRDMIVRSQVLGTLTVSEDEVVRFAAGLIGLPDCRSFVLLRTEREGVFWLQSVEHGALAFVLIDPFLYFDRYEVEVSPADLAELGAESPEEVAILAIVTLPRTREEQPTANLQGPVAVNLRANLGKQMAIQETEFGVRCPVDLLKAVAE